MKEAKHLFTEKYKTLMKEMDGGKHDELERC